VTAPEAGLGVGLGFGLGAALAASPVAAKRRVITKVIKTTKVDKESRPNMFFWGEGDCAVKARVEIQRFGLRAWRREAVWARRGRDGWTKEDKTGPGQGENPRFYKCFWWEPQGDVLSFVALDAHKGAIDIKNAIFGNVLNLYKQIASKRY